MVRAVRYTYQDVARLVQLQNLPPIIFALRNGISMAFVEEGPLLDTILSTKAGCCGNSRIGFHLATDEEIKIWKGDSNE